MASNLISVIPSPSKTECRATNYNLCVICQESTEAKLLKINTQSYNTILNICELRLDEVVVRLKQDIASKSDFLEKSPMWHNACRGSWTSKTNVTYKRKLTTSLSCITEEKRTRRQMPNYDIKLVCLFCGKSTRSGRKRHEKLTPVSSFQIQQTIFGIAKNLNDENVLHRIQANSEVTMDLIAAEAKYHRTCYTDFWNKSRSAQSECTGSENIYDIAFEKLCLETEPKLKSGKILYISDLRKAYVLKLETLGIKAEESTKYKNSNLKRRLINKYGDEISFWSNKGRESDLVYDSSLSTGRVIAACMELKQNIEENFVPVVEDSCESMSNEDTEEDIANKALFNVAIRVKSDMKTQKVNETLDERDVMNIDYNEAEAMIPDSLYNLIACILCDDIDISEFEQGKINKRNKTVNKMSVHEQILNMAQSVLYANTGMKTPLNVGIAVYIYHKTRSRDIITMLNRFGICISYMELQRILTTVAVNITDKCSGDNIFIPSNIVPETFSQFAIDNLDFSECTLDGTSKHVTSMVVYQNTEALQSGSFCEVPVQTQRKTSLGKSECLPDLNTVFEIRKLRRDMRPSNPVDMQWLLQTDNATSQVDLNMCWLVSRLCPTKLLEIEVECPSWKVFHASVGKPSSNSTTIGYCPFIQSSPTNPEVVRKALEICMTTSARLGLQHTVVTQDQAIYEIAYTLRKTNIQEFENVILRLGGFHLLMNYLGSIGKVVAGSGFIKLLSESDVMLEGTVNKILSGKSYYQAVNAHMRVYEAMSSLWWSAFEDFALSQEVGLDTFVKLCDHINDLNENLQTDKDKANEIVTEMKQMIETMKLEIERFRETRSDYKTSEFWLSYLSMIENMLAYIHAEREGIWDEHISAVKEMAKIIAVADHQKYVKAIVSYLDEMRTLPILAPEVYEEFKSGNFTVKRADGCFNGIWTDMALECSQNCDAKGKTGQAGLKGVTLNTEMQEKWFLTLPFCAAVSGDVKQMIHENVPESVHHEDNKATYKRETQQRDAIVDTINKEMINPFKYDKKDLINIENGLKADDEIATDLLQVEEKGMQAIRTYLEQQTYTKVNLKTFANMEKSRKYDKIKKSKNELTGEVQVLKRALRELNREDADINHLEDIMKHELRSYPPSIAELDPDKQEISLRHGNKASLLDTMKKRAELEEWPSEINESDMDTAIVIDVMAMVRINMARPDEESESYAKRLFGTILKRWNCKQLHLVADRYDGLHGTNVCLKDASGCRERRGSSSKVYDIRKGMLMKNFNEIVQNNISKSNLIAFLFEVWCENPDMIPADTSVFLGGGFKDRTEVKIMKSTQDIPEGVTDQLKGVHEEADSRVFLHIKMAVELGCRRVIICGSDTDIVVIAIYMFKQLFENGLMELFVKSCSSVIPVHALVRTFSEEERDMLPLMHALSGCDTNGYFFGKGKVSFLKSVNETNTSCELSRLTAQIKDDLMEETVEGIVRVATVIVSFMYNRKVEHSLNTVRANMYYSGKKALESIPPTDDAFRQHVLRAIFQTYIWINSDVSVPNMLDPLQFGFNMAAGVVRPCLMLRPALPDYLLQDNFCKCKKFCVRNCSCKRLNLKCDIACGCRGPGFCSHTINIEEFD